MTTNQLVGSILIGVGFLDMATGLLIIAPRMQDPEKKKIILMALGTGAFVMIVLGALFLLGVIPLGEQGG